MVSSIKWIQKLMGQKEFFILAVLTFPESMVNGKVSPIFSQIKTLDIKNTEYRLGTWIGTKDYFMPKGLHFIFEPIAFTTIIKARDIDEASKKLESHDEAIELVLDLLSFQYLSHIKIRWMQILDITQPLRLDDKRKCKYYLSPYGYRPDAKFLISTPVNNKILPEDFIYATDSSAMSKVGRKALRYFTKGLSLEVNVEKFYFFWTCLEIIAESKPECVVTQKPYFHPNKKCCHIIDKCPVCNIEAPLKKLVGETVKKFLVENLNIQKKLAEELWEFRQIVHGRNDLSKKQLQNLQVLLLKLEAAAFEALKIELNLPNDKCGNILENDICLNNTPIVHATHTISEEDIDRINYYWKKAIPKTVSRP